MVFFFDPKCSHCKAETDTLLTYYKELKQTLNFDIYAVCSDTSMVLMKQYIRERNIPWTVVNGPRTITPHYSTLYDVPSLPAMFLLDKNKKIIAKRLTINQMIDMMKKEKEKEKR
jgi:hypothetical protein